MKFRFFVLYLMTVFLCLSFGSCKKEQTSEERKHDIEVANSNDNKEEVIDSLNGASADSIVNAGEMKKTHPHLFDVGATGIDNIPIYDVKKTRLTT